MGEGRREVSGAINPNRRHARILSGATYMEAAMIQKKSVLVIGLDLTARGATAVNSFIEPPNRTRAEQ